MNVPVFDLKGKEVRKLDLPDAVFGVEPNRAVLHQAVVRQQANAHLGTHKTQTRTEVNRTKSKWYRQKGTGRARHGSRAAPIFVGGGVAHGPQPRSYTQKMPRKMRRLALRSALAAKAQASAIALVEGLSLDGPKTGTMRDLIDAACNGARTLVLLAGRNENVERSVRNLPNAKYLGTANLNVRDLLRFEKLLIEVDALPLLEAHLGGSSRRSEAVDA